MFSVAIRKDSDLLLKFFFRSYVQVFSCEILLICHLKYPYSFFYSHFCFLVFVLFVFILPVLSLLFLKFFSSPRIYTFTLSSMMERLLPPYFLDTYNLSHFPSVKHCAFTLIFLSSSSSLVHFIMFLSILQRRPFCFLFFWWDFLMKNWFHEVFSFNWGTLFYSYFYLRLFDGVHFQYSQIVPSLVFFFTLICWIRLLLSYLPTPPLGQDMTQGQF